MPHLKFDSSKPEQLLEVLKGMHLQEGAELEIEQVENGILLKPVSSEASDQWQRKIATLPPPAKNAEERNRIIQLLGGNREDDEGDIPLDEILAARTSILD